VIVTEIGDWWTYTEHASEIGFGLRQLAAIFEPTSITQLIQVGFLRCQLRLA